MDGHLYNAKNLLETTLETDSTNALAWFELYRTYEHIRNGEPRKMTDINNSRNCLKKALEYDPQNPYYSYLQANLEILNYYIQLMTQENKEGLQKLLKEAEKHFVKAEETNPVYLPGLLTLVEFYSQMPPDMGGDQEKAEKYIQYLAKKDSYLGARARSMKLENGENEIQYWNKLLEKTPNDPNILESLGRAYLLHNRNCLKAHSCFEQAMDLDHSKSDLYLVLARFQMMEGMQNQEKIDSILPLMEHHFKAYLEKVPEVTNAKKAWILSKIAQGKMQSGRQEEGGKIMDKAKKLDPYFPKAFSAPVNELPPDEAHKKIEYGYFLRPF